MDKETFEEKSAEAWFGRRSVEPIQGRHSAAHCPVVSVNAGTGVGSNLETGSSIEINRRAAGAPENRRAVGR
jgi:hypothetical protein